MSKICLRCYVTGRVQGVFYRESTRRKAKELNVSGWIHNLPDGRVEVFACGEKAAVDALCDWLWDGPPAADVTDVVMQEVPWEEHSGFEVR